jgi:spermidine synthase
MLTWEKLDSDSTPNGGEIALYRRDTEYSLRVDSVILMNSRSHGSEERLASLTAEALGARPGLQALIGGLGMGFTLKAFLRRSAADAHIDVAELLPAVVRWNQGVLGALAGRPLDDPRAHLLERDVVDVIRESEGTYDAILLDVDNGPSALTTTTNSTLYGNAGLRCAFSALRKSGILAVWSADWDRAFAARLKRVGFDVRAHRPRARPDRATRNVIWLAKRH